MAKAHYSCIHSRESWFKEGKRKGSEGSALDKDSKPIADASISVSATSHMPSSNCPSPVGHNRRFIHGLTCKYNQSIKPLHKWFGRGGAQGSGLNTGEDRCVGLADEGGERHLYTGFSWLSRCRRAPTEEPKCSHVFDWMFPNSWKYTSIEGALCTLQPITVKVVEGGVQK